MTARVVSSISPETALLVLKGVHDAVGAIDLRLEAAISSLSSTDRRRRLIRIRENLRIECDAIVHRSLELLVAS